MKGDFDPFGGLPFLAGNGNNRLGRALIHADTAAGALLVIYPGDVPDPDGPLGTYFPTDAAGRAKGGCYPDILCISLFFTRHRIAPLYPGDDGKFFPFIFSSILSHFFLFRTLPNKTLKSNSGRAILLRKE
jgi:hypothetical protein